MLIIIDGHNLIPKIPGLSLSDIDDEEKLLALLKEYARLRRKDVVVFFDGAPPGQAGERRYSTLRVHFVPAGRTADDAICQYLEGLGKAARNTAVVSSDRQVQANVRKRYARVLSSEDFARQLSELRDMLGDRLAGAAGKKQTKPPAQPKSGARNGSAANLDQWLDLFGLDPASAEKPIDLSKRPPRKSSSVRHKADNQPPAGPPASSESQQEHSPQQKRSRRYHGFQKKP